MGRLIIFLLVLIVFLLGILVTSKIFPLFNRYKSQDEKRKSFDKDIEEVAKKIKSNN